MDDDLSGSESGGTLRQKLEDALAANRDLHTQLVGYRAKDVIGEKGFKYVTPEDLTGVPLDDLADKAAEIEQSKQAQRETVLREVLTERGVPEDQFDTALAALLGNGQSTQSPADSVITNVSRIQGAAPGTLPDQNVYGEDRIRAAYAKS